MATTNKWADKFYKQDELVQELEKVNAKLKSGGGVHKFVEGTTVLRVLPGVDGKYYLEHVGHYVEAKDPKTGKIFPHFIPCKKFYTNKPCLICNYVEMLKDSGDKRALVLADKFKLSNRYMVQAIIRRERKEGEKESTIKEGEGIKRVLMGIKMHKSILGLTTDPEIGVGNVADVYEGCDIVVKRTGMDKNNTEYNVSAARSKSPLHEDDDQIDEWMNNRISWEDVIKVPKDSDIQALIPEISVLNNKDEEEVEEKEEVVAKKSSKKVVTEDDEDDEPVVVKKKGIGKKSSKTWDKIEDED